MLVNQVPSKFNDLINRKKLLVFDFDGVIADSVEVKTDAFAELYKSYGKEIEQKVINHHRNHGGMSRFEKFQHYHTEFLKKSVNENEVSQLSEEFSKLVVDKVISSPEIKGANTFLKESAISCTLEAISLN